MDAIKLRRSIRKFDLSKKIPYDTLVELCKYASYAPTARRQIDKEYIIIDSEEVINKMKDLPHGTLKYEDCNTYIALVAKDPNSLTIPGMEPIDLGMAAENILIKACDLGFGSCYLGVYPSEERMKSFNELLGVNNNDFVFGIIALGYPKEEFREWDKFDPNTIHHNKY
ncbi:MAG: nitroreductase family protein [Acholeplasmatales bacterium]|nr:nitroreductase family protein [Acholeplasmatales bacterium]